MGLCEVPLSMSLLGFGMGTILASFHICGIDRVWSSKECACCACDPSVHLSVPSIGVVYVFVCRKLSPHLRV